eukprot:gene3302-5059_t
MSLPELCVFDLDDCLWHPEMYTIHDIPSEAVLGELSPGVQGVVGAKGGSTVVELFPAALKVLQDIHRGKYGSMKIAAASSADTPKAVACAKASMDILEIVPGVTMKQLFDTVGGGYPADVIASRQHLQIGRSPPLSSNKTTHFSFLTKATGIAYDKMLFFDDCSWGDNCGTVRRGCKGVTTVVTPDGVNAATL